MKNNLLPSIAIIIGITLSSAIIKNDNFSDLEFKLISRPISAGIVADPSNWRTTGVLYGECTPLYFEDIACTITLNSTTMTDYYHAVSGGYLLNTQIYAAANSKKYLTIYERQGVLVTSPDPHPGQYWIIDSYSGTYLGIIPSDSGVTFGTDFNYENAKYAE